MRIAWGATLVASALLACGERGARLSPPLAATSSVSAAPPPAAAPAPVASVPVASAPRPRPPPPVLRVGFVNLAVSRAFLTVNADGEGTFEAEVHDGLGEDSAPVRVEGMVTEAALKKLADAMKRSRLCSFRPPDDEPMTWTHLESYLPGVTCNRKMAPAVWRRHHPDVLRALREIEREICGGTCPHPPAID